MTIWKVTCEFTTSISVNGKTEESVYSFGSYDGALMWVVNNADVLRWASIEENNYIPCNKDNPDGQLYIGCDVFQYFERNQIMALKYISENIK